MSRDEAELALPLLTGAVRDHFAVGDEQPTSGDLAIVYFRLPPELACLCIERQEESVRRTEVDHVLVDAEVLTARRSVLDGRRIVALVLPDQIAIRGVEGLDAAARCHHVHHAAVDDRRRFLRARWQAARPGHAKLGDVALVDLVERAEPMLVVGAADVQPVCRVGIGQHRLRDRDERRGLGEYGLRPWTRDCDGSEHGDRDEAASLHARPSLLCATP